MMGLQQVFAGGEGHYGPVARVRTGDGNCAFGRHKGFVGDEGEPRGGYGIDDPLGR